MKKKLSILIFTDLDGTLLHRDTFTFGVIKNYIKDIISDRIYLIPNTSKTDKEILSFNQKLGEALPYITENGSAIKGLNLINKDLPKELILSKEKEELINIFENEVPDDLKIKCKWITKMNKENQLKILGIPEDQITNALDRKYTVPFIFVVSENIADWYSENYKILRPTVLFNSPYEKHLKKNYYFGENFLLNKNQKVILYQGSLDPGRGIEKIISAFKKRVNDKVVIIFLGYGSLENKILLSSKKREHIFTFKILANR